jgi:integrase
MAKPVRYSSAFKCIEGWFAAAGLVAQRAAYVQYLTERGYGTRTIKVYFRCVAHFVHWFTERGVGASQITEALIERFLDRHLPHCRCHCLKRFLRVRCQVRPALGHFLAMLRSEGTCPRQPTTDSSVIATELRAFRQHLIEVRGLCEGTCSSRLRYVRDFLIDRFRGGPVRIPLLTPIDVCRFMRRYTVGWAPCSIKEVANSLRSYFLFKASQGKLTQALIAALPRVAQWRLARVPEVLSPTQIQKLLRAFDRRGRTGRRDYAITRCLLDLGLRRAEVAHLRLDDVDWRAGTLSIHSKGPRIDVMPLPKLTGRAIVAYLRHGRPQTTRREIFVRHRPPINTPANLDIVRGAVRLAAKRCGLEKCVRGTHIFRRTVACRMVQAGTPFKQIADLLRHRTLDTTTLYAKVDFASLSHVALPWPGRHR